MHGWKSNRFRWLVHLVCFVVLMWGTEIHAAPPMPMPPMGPLQPTGNPPTPPMFMGGNTERLNIPGVTIPSYLIQGPRRWLSVPGEGVIRGVVMDAEHDKPIPDARVVLIRQDDSGGRQTLVLVESLDADATGAFTFEELPAGEYLLEACHFGATMVPWNFGAEEDRVLTLGDGEERDDVTVPIYGGHRIRVLLNGAPAADETTQGRMAMRSSILQTSVERQYLLKPDENFQSRGSTRYGSGIPENNIIEFQGVFGREVKLTFERSQYWVQGKNGERVDELVLELSPELLDVEVEVDVMPPVKIRGRITDREGRPAGIGDVDWSMARTGRGGIPTRQSPGPVREDGTFEVTVPGRQDGFLFFQLDGRNPIRYGPIVLKDSVPDALDLVIPQGNELNVTVLGPDGEPAAGAVARLSISDIYIPQSSRDELPEARFMFLPKQPQMEESTASVVMFMGTVQNHGFEATADEEGIARFENLSGGHYSLRVTGAPGSRHAPSSALDVTIFTDAPNNKAVKLDWFKPFAGVVLDEAGEPITEAVVELGQMGMPRGEPQQAVTDAEGHFRFENVSRDDVRQVYLRMPDNPDRRHHVGSWLPGIEDAVLQVGKQTSVQARRLKVLDGETEEPVKNAVLKAWDGTPLEHQVYKEDGMLEYVLITSEEKWGMVTAEGYAPMPLELTGRFGGPGEIRLMRPGTISGRIVDEESGEPLGGVRIEYLRPRPHPNQEAINFGAMFTVHSGEDGRFAMEGVPIFPRRPPFIFQVGGGRMDAAVEVFAGEEYAMQRTNIVVEEPGDVDLGDIAMGAGRTIDVRVSRDGMAVVDTPVSLAVQFPALVYPAGMRDFGSVRTNEEGVAQFARIPDGQVNLSLVDYGFHRRLSAFQFRDQIEFRLGSNEATFEVRNEEGPVHTSLSVSGPDGVGYSRPQIGGTANANDGVHRLENLISGTWKFEFHGPSLQIVNVDMEDSSPRDVIPVVYGRHNVTIRVDTVGEEEPPRFQWVELSPVSESIPGVERHFRASWSQQDNNVTFEAIPAGEYRLSMATNSLPIKWVDSVINVANDGVDQELTVPLADDGGEIVVRATDMASGLPLVNWHATVYMAGRSGYAADPINVEPGERAEFTDIPPGRIRVQATASHYLTETMELDLEPGGALEVELRLEPGGTLMLSLGDEGGREEARQRQGGYSPYVELVPLDEGRAGEKPLILYLPPPRQGPRTNSTPLQAGRYDVRVMDNGREIHREEVTIRLGEMTRVEVGAGAE